MDWKSGGPAAIGLVAMTVVLALSCTRRNLRIGALAMVAVAALSSHFGWLEQYGVARAGHAFVGWLRGFVDGFWTEVLGAEEPTPTVTVVGVLSLLGGGWWLLEWIAGRSESPQVTVAGPEEKDTDDVQRLLRELRFRLPAVAVHCPSRTPGTARGDAVASVAEATEIQGGKLLAGFIRLWTWVMPSPPRYVARLHAERCGDSHTGVTDSERDPLLWVTVDIRDQRTEKSLAVTTFDMTKLSDAAERAAAFVAATVLRMDKYVPDWSKQGPDRADDLAAYLLCPPVPGYGHSYAEVLENRRDRRRKLEPVARNGSVSGIVRYELAVLDELDGRPLEALRLHARNRAEYPRFGQGRYRLAMALSMAAGDAVVDRWTAAAGTVLYRDIVHWLSRSDVAAGLPELPEYPDDPTRFRRVLLDVAEQEFISYRNSQYLGNRALTALRHRSERSRLRMARSTKAHVVASGTAIQLCQVRRDLLLGRRPIRKLESARRQAVRLIDDRCAERGFPWQHAYNLACLLALTMSPSGARLEVERDGDLDLVIGLLELVAESPASRRISEWIGRDPDLQPLHGRRPFEDLVRERVRRDFGPWDTGSPPPSDADWFTLQVYAAHVPETHSPALRILRNGS